MPLPDTPVGPFTRLSANARAQSLCACISAQAQLSSLPEFWSLTERSGLASLEQEVTRQATMIAFNNSFMVIGIVMLALIPFIVFFRYSRR